MIAVLLWPVFASVACALFSNSPAVGKHAQDLLERPLVHASWLNRHGTVSAPLEPGAQFFDATRRAIPTMTHGELIGDASATAANEEPDMVISASEPSVEDACNALLDSVTRRASATDG